MVVCIAGMHRSGTSMVARLLQQCGLYLGDEASMLPPAPDNPEGFFEHAGFVALNDEVLKALGGAWDAPPPAMWAIAPELPALRERAAALVAGFAAHAPWGWKDPRNSLTLPFWQSVVPDLRIVVCLRNPIAVASSLAARSGVTQAFGLRLWQAYHERVLAAVPADQLVVTHYNAYFEDPEAEIRRLCAALDLDAAGAALADATAAVRERLQHHRPTTAQVVSDVRQRDVVETYLRLCSLAGPVCTAALAAEPFGTAPASESRVWMDELLRARVARLEAEVGAHAHALEAELAEQTTRQAAALAERDARLAALDAARAEQDAALDAARAETARLAAELTAARAELAEATRWGAEIAEAHADTSARLAEVTWERDEIVQSRAWRVMRWMWRVRRVLLPPGSRRARLAAPRTTGS